MRHSLAYSTTFCEQNERTSHDICLALFLEAQRWLGRCKIAKDRSKVNNNIANFDNILDDIWDNCLTVNLPSVFTIMAKSKPPKGGNPFTREKVQDTHGQKKKCGDDMDVRVINDKANDDLQIKKGEN